MTASFTVAKNDLQFMPRKTLQILLDDSGTDANPWTLTEDATYFYGTAEANTYDIETKITNEDMLDVSLFTFNLIEYLLQVEFSTDAPTPLTSPYVGEVGSLDVIDTADVMAVSGGAIVPNATTTAGGDPSLLESDTFSRIAGMTIIIKARNYTTYGSGNNSIAIGVSTSATPTSANTTGFLIASNTVNALRGGLNTPFGIMEYTNDAFSKFAVILRGTGMFLIDIDNSLIVWVENLLTDATLRSVAVCGVTSRAPFGLDFIRRVQLSAPFDTDFGLAMDGQAGAISAGTTFTASSANNATDGDGIHELITTTLASVGDLRYFFRIQDADNYWRIRFAADGSIVLQEVVATVVTSRGTLGAGTLSGGERIVIIVEDTTIKIYYDNTLGITYSSASNFKTETSAELDTLGTGGAVDDLWIFPRQLAGDALTELNQYTA